MQAKMEKIVVSALSVVYSAGPILVQMTLLGVLLFLVLLIAYLLAQSYHRDSKRTSRWSLPSHFTIPILSPFTSVVRQDNLRLIENPLMFLQVEHETSVIGTWTIAVFLVVFAFLGYAIFRHWAHSLTSVRLFNRQIRP
jgi:hypothetical protein